MNSKKKVSGPIALGRLVRDRITNFTGIAICEARWLNGCVRWTVQPEKLDKDGKVQESACFDVEQLEVVGAGLNVDSLPSGGPKPSPRRQPDPSR